MSTVTPAGEIDFANRPLLDYLGVSLEQLQDWPSFIHESDRATVTERWQFSVDKGHPFEAEFRLRRSDGVYRWFGWPCRAGTAEDGSIVAGAICSADIEDRKQAEDLRRSSERRLRAISTTFQP